MGKVVNTVGLKGEIKVYNYSDSTEIYEIADSLFIGSKSFCVENVRIQKNMPILQVEGIDDRNAAERMRGKEIFVSEEFLPRLPEGEHYVKDLLGMKVVTEEGRQIGVLKDIIQNTAQDVYNVETSEGGQVLIPGVPEFLINIDDEERVITVRLIDGMLNGADAVEA